MPPKKSRRGTLASRIDQNAEGDPRELSELVERLQRDQSDSEALAQQASTIQNLQDPQLDNYIAFCRKIIKVLPEDDEEYSSLPQREKDLGLFPENHEELYQRIGIFILFSAQATQGETHTENAYANLILCRAVLISRATRAHDQHGLDDIPQGRFYRKLTDCIESAVARYNIPKPANLTLPHTNLSKIKSHDRQQPVSEGDLNDLDAAYRDTEMDQDRGGEKKKKRRRSFELETAVEYSDAVELPTPIPHPTNSAITLGDPRPLVHPGTSTVSTTEMNTPMVIPKRMRHLIKTVPVEELGSSQFEAKLFADFAHVDKSIKPVSLVLQTEDDTSVSGRTEVEE